MPEINLIDFFTYFKGTPEQKEAVQLLQSAMPDSLLRQHSHWVECYRKQPETPLSVVPPQCLEIIAEFEGFRPAPYDDGVGVATIGYGSTFYEDGTKVTFKDFPITEPQARSMMKSIVEEDFWNVLKITIPYWEEMNDNQRSALTSFGYNLGSRFYGSSGFNTISACLTDHAWDEVPSALMLYVNPGSSVEAGLKRRRKAEGELWVAA